MKRVVEHVETKVSIVLLLLAATHLPSTDEIKKCGSQLLQAQLRGSVAEARS